MKPQHRSQFPANCSESLKEETLLRNFWKEQRHKQRRPGLVFAHLSVPTHLSLGKAQESIAETMLYVFMEFWVWVITQEYGSEGKVEGVVGRAEPAPPWSSSM